MDLDELQRQIERLEMQVGDLTRGTNTMVTALRDYFTPENGVVRPEPLERLLDDLDEAWSQLP